MAGNGGEMAKNYEAVLKQADKKKQKAHAAKTSNACITKSKKLNSKPTRQAGGLDGAALDEAEDNAELNERVKAKLCTTANRKLGYDCQRLVNGLMNKAVLGDARCAALLFALAGPSDKRKSAARKRRVRALVEELATEQEWSSEMNEVAAAMIDGGPGTRTETVVVPVATAV